MDNYRLLEDRIEAILAVSGGADSVYLLNLSRKKFRRLLVAHYNHGVRGKESEEDQRFLSSLCKDWGLSMEVGRAQPEATESPITGRKGKVPPRFEEKAREKRYAFLNDLLERHKARQILVAHTADDQVETILMRFMEGGGITGLKGIPRVTDDGIERPLLDIWREDILKYLKKKKIRFRVDKSNYDTRFERNWVRHVLLPLLEERYGKSVKKRIFTLGERFREIDAYMEENARNWIRERDILLLPKRSRNKKKSAAAGKESENGDHDYRGRKRRGEVSSPEVVAKEAVTIPRKAYAGLPSVLRIKILQILCFERIGTEPNERLLASMDRLIVSGGASARLNIGKGGVLRCRYGEAILSPPVPGESHGTKNIRSGHTKKRKQEKSGKEIDGRNRETMRFVEPIVPMEGPGKYGWMANEDPASVSTRSILWEEKGKTAMNRIRRQAEGEQWAVFDGGVVASPLYIRSLRAGDRIRPFGHVAEKKAKEVLIDRKVPRDERWGRPVVCDAKGEILWIPGVVRSAHAPVTAQTRRTIVLRSEIPEKTSS